MSVHGPGESGAAGRGADGAAGSGADGDAADEHGMAESRAVDGGPARDGPARKDPGAITAQPALTTSSGRRWLVWGAVLDVVILVVLGLLATIDPVVAITGAVVVVLLYIAMVIVRVSVRPRRARLYTMASLFGASAVAGLVFTLLVGGVAVPTG